MHLSTAMQLNKLLTQNGFLVIEKDSKYLKELHKKTQKGKKRLREDTIQEEHQNYFQYMAENFP